MSTVNPNSMSVGRKLVENGKLIDQENIELDIRRKDSEDRKWKLMASIL